MTWLDGFVQAQNVAPIVVGAGIMSVLGGAVKGEIEATDFAKVVSLHVSGDASLFGSFVGIIHPIEIFDRVFDHPCFPRKNVSKEGFHNLNLLRLAFVRQPIFESWNKFHCEMGIFGINERNLNHRHGDKKEGSTNHISEAIEDHCRYIGAVDSSGLIEVKT